MGERAARITNVDVRHRAPWATGLPKLLRTLSSQRQQHRRRLLLHSRPGRATGTSEESESDLSILSTTSTIRNRLTTGSLTTLLDARKEVKSPAEYKRLCDDFNCDADVIDKLARYVTSPSLTLQRSEKQEKEDTYMARWTDPAPF